MDQLVIPFLIFVFVFTTCLFDIVDIVRINSALVTCGSKRIKPVVSMLPLTSSSMRNINPLTPRSNL